MHFSFYKLLYLMLFTLVYFACTKDNRPTVGSTNKVELTTNSVFSIGSDSAICTSVITSDGGDPVTERGICWATNSSPTVNLNRTENGSGVGIYSSILKPLSQNTTYYVRAYIKNAQGIIYGNQLSFKTKVALPVIQTVSAISITQTAATTGGSTINDFGSPITQKGICWSTTNVSPNLSNNVVLAGSGNSSFALILQNLSPNTIYYARAFATNAGGTGYGNSIQFRTLPALIPSITTNNITNIGRNSATSGGNISYDGGAFVTQRGICWSTSINPTTANSVSINGSGSGTFLSQMAGLQANQTYFVRAFAINSVGIAYGPQLSFTTLANQLPSITTSSIINVSRTSAQGGGNVIDDGGLFVTQRGVCWSTFQNPTISNSRTVNGSGIGLFSSTITGLSPGTTYFLRAYATNALGTSYGIQTSFRTSF